MKKLSRSLLFAGVAAAVALASFQAIPKQTASKPKGVLFLPASEFAKLPVKRIYYHSVETIVRGGRGLTPSRPASNTRLKGDVPEVMSQGETNDCVGWAVGYYARTIVARASGQNTSGAFSPAFVYNIARHMPPNEQSNRCDAIYVESGLSTLNGFGALPFNDFPPDGNCGKEPTPRQLDSARNFRIRDWTVADSRESVLSALANGSPVVFSIQFHQSFKDFKGSGTYVDLETSRPWDEGHALTIIGYDDRHHGGAYLVVNSWGKDWGNGGFAWVSYDSLDRMATTSEDGKSMYHAYALVP